MNDSYRATLIIMGLLVALSAASWRLLKLEAMPTRTPMRERPVVTTQREAHPAPAVRVEPKQPAPDPAAELIAAAQRGDMPAVLDLVAKGANINAVGRDGLTPLLASINHGNAAPGIIEKLLSAGADATAKDANGHDALTLAVERDDVNTIGTLLKTSPKLIGRAAAAACYAAAQNHIEALKALVDNNVDINRADKQGRTPLEEAIARGEPDTVRFLLDHNADPNRKTPGGVNALMLAAAKGKRDLLPALIEKTANVNERNSTGETALMQVVRADNLAVAKALVEAGCDVNAADLEGMTPLMAAASAGRNEIVQLLLDKGADPRATDNQGDTAVTLARSNDHNDTADLITKALGPEGAQQ